MGKSFIILFVLILGCTKNEPVEKKANTPVPSEIVKTVCPLGIGASEGDTPKLEIIISSKMRLILCGYSTESEYDIYSVNEMGVLSGPLLTHGALEHVRAYNESGVLVLDEKIYYSGSWVSAFRRKFLCNGSCHISKSVCIFKRPKVTNVAPLREIMKYKLGKKIKKVIDETLILDLADLAYAGNKTAQKFFFSTHANIQLDGASAEVYVVARKFLQRLQSGNCL
jgi:hypothetical protein